jgi:hypothetical protein
MLEQIGAGLVDETVWGLGHDVPSFCEEVGQGAALPHSSLLFS